MRGFGLLLLVASLAWAKADPAPEPPPAPDLARIEARGRLVVGMVAQDNPPFFMVRGGVLQGIDVELAEGLGRELGVPVVFDRTARSFNEVIDKVARGEVDLAVSKLSRTFPRARRVLFSRPYIRLRHGLLVNRLALARVAGSNAQAVQVIRDFRGRLGVLEGTSYVEFAKTTFPSAQVVPMKTWEEVVNAVEKGSVMAAFRDDLETRKVLLENPQRALRVRSVALSGSHDEKAIALPPGSVRLQALVDLYLENRRVEWTTESILKRYGAGFVPPASVSGR